MSKTNINASGSAVAEANAIVVFGIDEHDKPRAARFFRCRRGCEDEFTLFHKGQEDEQDLVLRSYSLEDREEVADDTRALWVREEWRSPRWQ